MLADTKIGEPEEYIGEKKEEKKEEKKMEDKKEAKTEMKPPEEFIYDPVAQEESH